MENETELLRKFDEVIQYFIAYPDSKTKAGFGENISKLIDIKADLANGVDTRTEPILPIQNVIDSKIINKYVKYKGKDYKIYNVSLMLEPEDDSKFEKIFYQKLRDSE